MILTTYIFVVLIVVFQFSVREASKFAKLTSFSHKLLTIPLGAILVHNPIAAFADYTIAPWSPETNVEIIKLNENSPKPVQGGIYFIDLFPFNTKR